MSDLLREARNTQLKQGLTNRHTISGYAEWSREGSTAILIQGLGNEEVKEFAQSQSAELDSSQAMWYSVSSPHHLSIQPPTRNNTTFKIVGTRV